MRVLAAVALLVSGCGRIGFDAARDVDGAPCVPGAVVVDTVTTGELVIGATATEASVPMTVPLERSILFVSVREAEPAPTYGAVMCELLVTGIGCRRTVAGTDYASSTGQLFVRWTVATFSAGVSVQRGITSIDSGPLVTLAPVVADASFVILGGAWNNVGNSWGTNEFMRASLLDATKLELTSFEGGQDASWQVVTMQGASVQRGGRELPVGLARVDAPIAPVQLDRTLPLISHTADSSTGLGTAWEMVGAELVDASTLRIERVAVAGPIDVRWEVISLPFTVVHGVSTMPPGTTTVSEPVTGLGPTSSVVLASTQSLFGAATGATDGTQPTALADLVGESAATLQATPGAVAITRATALSNARIPWSAIDFARPTCGP